MHEALSPPGPGPYEILSGSPMIAGQAACMRPGKDPLLVMFPATPWNAMNGWVWAAAPGGTGFTLTSQNSQVLVYLPNEGLNVRMMPPSHISDPGAAWIPVFAGQNVYFAIVSAVDQSLALAVFDSGPPWGGEPVDRCRGLRSR